MGWDWHVSTASSICPPGQAVKESRLGPYSALRLEGVLGTRNGHAAVADSPEPLGLGVGDRRCGGGPSRVPEGADCRETPVQTHGRASVAAPRKLLPDQLRRGGAFARPRLLCQLRGMCSTSHMSSQSGAGFQVLSGARPASEAGATSLPAPLWSWCSGRPRAPSCTASGHA